MNDSELKARLKGIPLPARTAGYWERFPSRVRSQLRPVPADRPQNAFFFQLTWGTAVAFAVLIFALAVWPAFQVTLKDARTVRRELAQFPNHLRTFMANEHGLHYLIADQQ
jgi:hypothetical protein